MHFDKRTFCDVEATSAFTPKADMCRAIRHVRFVPIADMSIFSCLSQRVRFARDSLKS